MKGRKPDQPTAPKDVVRMLSHEPQAAGYVTFSKRQFIQAFKDGQRLRRAQPGGTKP